MRRSIENYLQEYEKLEKQGKGMIYCNEILDIIKKSSDIVELIYIAYKVGIVRGYRIGKRK